MTANEFARELSALRPDERELLRVGLSGKEVAKFLKYWQCVQRPRPKPINMGFVDELVRLIAGWDLKDVAIGPVTFYRASKHKGHWIHIGEVDGDILAVNVGDGYVSLLGVESKGAIVYQVAESAEKCLDALIIVAAHLTKCIIQEDVANDKRAARRAAREASAAAGGERFLEFFRYLLTA